MQDPILHFNGTSLDDLTKTLRQPFDQSISLNVNSLYLASPLPIKTFYAGIETAAATGETLEVEYYAGPSNGWVSSVQTNDQTDGLSASGYITIQPDPNKPWSIVGDTLNVSDLSSVRFFNWYWYKITLSGPATVDFQWFGHKFCEDEDITRRYPGLANDRAYKAFNKVVNSWEDLIIEASEELITDLRGRFSLEHAAQILDHSDLRSMCRSKTAQFIFGGLGSGYADEALAAEKQYEILLSQNNVSVDKSKDGTNDPMERTAGQYDLIR